MMQRISHNECLSITTEFLIGEVGEEGVLKKVFPNIIAKEKNNEGMMDATGLTFEGIAALRNIVQ